ncbi:MAG: hypothetical protein AB1773_11430 [Pseudomonadota bacterium]
MTPQDVLAELLARIGANGGAAVYLGAQELAEWPAGAVAALKTWKLIVPARPAASVVCPGCERQCVMPVHVIPAQAGAARAFVVCDKRDDINRVNVPIAHLEQWQASGDTVAAWLAGALGLARPDHPGSNASRWEVGMFKGSKLASHLILLAEGELRLALAGHSLRLVDALELKDDCIIIDRRMLNRCVDRPVAGAGDTESAEQRRKRLRERVRMEKAKGTRAYLRAVAEEEGISPSRLKQLIAEPKKPASAWSVLGHSSSRTVSKAKKLTR